MPCSLGSVTKKKRAAMTAMIVTSQPRRNKLRLNKLCSQHPKWMWWTCWILIVLHKSSNRSLSASPRLLIYWRIWWASANNNSHSRKSNKLYCRCHPMRLLKSQHRSLASCGSRILRKNQWWWMFKACKQRINTNRPYQACWDFRLLSR